MVEEMKSILIPWIYYGAFGHVVEAIETANNYKTAHPESRVSVVLSKANSTAITNYCPWIDTTYTLDTERDIDQQLKSIPQSWDHIVYPLRLSYQPEQWYSSQLLDANRRLQEYLNPRLGAQFDDGALLSGIRLASQKYAKIRMQLPAETLRWAQLQRDPNASPVVSVLLNGSAPFSAFPSLRTWRFILEGISARFPTASFWLTGVSEKHGYAFSSAQSRNKAIRRLAALIPQLNFYIDVGIEKQLALIAASDVFLAPHTGFSFLAPCLGTPWLALSGGSWGDCTAGDTPFYFSLPACDRYPCHGNRKLVCRICDKLRTPVPCVASMLNARREDVLNGLAHLLDPTFDLQQSFHQYRKLASEQGVNVDELWRIAKYYQDVDTQQRL